MLCEAKDNSHWSSGIQVSDTLQTAKAEKTSRVEVEVENTAKYDTLLPNRIVLGRLDPASYPSEREFQETRDRYETLSPNLNGETKSRKTTMVSKNSTGKNI